MKQDDNLSKVFDIEPLRQGEVIQGGNEIVPSSSKIGENIDYDYDTSRNNLHKLLNQGQDALYSALEIAKQSEHPRAFEVVGNLMKQLADINEQLLKLSEKKNKLDNPVQVKGQEPKNVTNNAIFVGSTSELSSLINKMNNKGE
jgi:hypothetical protein